MRCCPSWCRHHTLGGQPCKALLYGLYGWYIERSESTDVATMAISATAASFPAAGAPLAGLGLHHSTGLLLIMLVYFVAAFGRAGECVPCVGGLAFPQSVMLLTRCSLTVGLVRVRGLSFAVLRSARQAGVLSFTW